MAKTMCRYVKRAMHGTHMMSWQELRESYGRDLVSLRNEARFNFLNTLFSVSEAVMYMQVRAIYPPPLPGPVPSFVRTIPLHAPRTQGLIHCASGSLKSSDRKIVVLSRFERRLTPGKDTPAVEYIGTHCLQLLGE
jgi:hypothetical protein